jgi:4-amino-4-deoxy-L-arabinose transferase-like glycosyltransferase
MNPRAEFAGGEVSAMRVPELSPAKRTGLFLAALFVFALAVRVASYSFLVGGLSDPPPAKTDAVEYDLLARNVADGIGFRYGSEHPPTAFRPPLYPLILASVYKVFGPSYLAARMLQFILSALACCLVWRLAWVLTASRALAMTASVIAVVYPSMFYHAGFLLTESVYIFFLVLSCLACAEVEKNPSLKNQILAGVSLGLLCLVRSNAVFFAFFLFFWALAVFENKAKAIRVYLTVLFFMLAALSPWAARNYLHFHRFIPLSTNGGMNFWGSNNPVILTEEAARYGGWKGGIIYDVSYLPGSEDLTVEWTKKEFEPFELDRRSWHLALQYLRNSPGDLARLVANKFERFWSVDIRNHPLERTAFILLDQGMVFWAILGFLGSLAARGRKPGLLLFFSFLAVQASALVFFADTRMRVGIAPSVVIYAAMGLRLLWMVLRQERREEIAPGRSFA